MKVSRKRNQNHINSHVAKTNSLHNGTGSAKYFHKLSTAVCGIQAWERMRSQGSKLSSLQASDEGWATVDDVVPPVYAWHVPDHQSEKPLVNDLKKYYGMLPAVVELFAQAGACVPKCYVGMMREDVMVPELDEEKFVV
ncbi:hypothetical protein V6N12_008513 [Hibiscus sabdariffa]|uniref:APO domain-containing protein n=1 Tax=Hibiscus sabdariffa TaxID=183260 RepID=A0ABR2BJ24_9ROSI